LSREYDFQIQGHPSIYTKHRKPRKLNIFFSEPEQGVNKDTGILLFEYQVVSARSLNTNICLI
jgi:hypothetical protein